MLTAEKKAPALVIALAFGLLSFTCAPCGSLPAVASPIGSLFPINGGLTYPGAVSLCYNPHSDQYLALWIHMGSPWQLKGRRIDAATGSLLGSEFYVSTNGAPMPAALLGSATYNSTNHEWFIVYDESACDGCAADLYGMRIASDGNIVAAGIPLVVKSGWQRDPRAAWDPVNEGYLMVWKEKVGPDPTDHEIYGKFFDHYGGSVGSEFMASDGTRHKYGPLVAYNPVVAEFMAVWQDGRNYPGSGQDNDWADVYGQRFDAATRTKIGGNTLLFGGGPGVPDGQDAPQGLACNTTDGRYGISVQRLQPTGATPTGWLTKGIIINHDGTSYSGVFNLSYPNYGADTHTAYSPYDNTYLMTWMNGADISAKKLSSTGAQVGGVMTVLAGPSGDGNGWVDARLGHDEFLCVAKNTSDGILYGQRFSTDSSPVPPPAPNVTSPALGSDVETQYPRIVWSGAGHDMYEVHINTTNVATDGSVFDSGEVTSPLDYCDVGPLAVDQVYYAFVRIRNGILWSDWSAAGHWFTVVENVNPPAAPTEFAGLGINSAVKLAWVNPTNSDLAGVMIRYRADKYPASASDGQLAGTVSGLIAGEHGSFTHSGLTNGIKYYYSAFAYDFGGLYSAPASDFAAPESWWYVYTADEFPSVSGFAILDDGGSENYAHIEPGGVLHVLDDSTDWGSKIRWYKDWGASLFPGATVLVRAKCDSASPGVYTTNLRIANGLHYINFVILPDRIASKPDNTTAYDQQYLLDGTAIHRYRITFAYSSGNTTYVCYVDEDPTPVFSGLAYSTSDHTLLFGVNGSASTQSIYFDYLCYHTSYATVPAGESETILQAKLSADGTSMTLPANVVSAAFTDYFYIQCPDDLHGTRVNMASHGVSVGDAVDVVGTVETNSDGERYISTSYVTVTGAGGAGVMGLCLSSLGGSDLSYEPVSGAGQRGEDGGLGPNTVGLLARTWGRVTDVDPSGQYFWIDEGSGPVKVLSGELEEPVGEPYVVVTGVSVLDASDGPVCGAIRPRTQADIEEL